MIVLFYDTETTGLVKDFDKPYTEANNYPRLVQLAYKMYDWQSSDHKTLIASGNFIVRPTFEIPEDAVKIHGITFDMAYQKGFDINFVLQSFHNFLRMADRVVCHNIVFDDGVMGQEYCLNWRTDVMAYHRSKQYCTKIQGKEICMIPDEKGGWKYPKLKEMYFHFFQSSFENQHSAMADTKALVKCYSQIEKYNNENPKANPTTQRRKVSATPSFNQ